MSLVFGAICPHPPIIIPAIGQFDLNQVQKTIDALVELESRLVQSKPDVILIISPHGPLEADNFNILGGNKLSGNFSQFGNNQIELDFRNDLEIAGLIQKEAKKITYLLN
jgi:aromatic ring-opening dioxygenase LigB subunit